MEKPRVDSLYSVRPLVFFTAEFAKAAKRCKGRRVWFLTQSAEASESRESRSALHAKLHFIPENQSEVFVDGAVPGEAPLPATPTTNGRSALKPYRPHMRREARRVTDEGPPTAVHLHLLSPPSSQRNDLKPRTEGRRRRYD